MDKILSKTDDRLEYILFDGEEYLYSKIDFFENGEQEFSSMTIPKTIYDLLMKK